MRKYFVSLDDLYYRLMFVAAVMMVYGSIVFIANGVRTIILGDPSSDTLIYIGAAFVGASLVTAALCEVVFGFIAYIILWTTHVRCKIDRRHVQSVHQHIS